MTKEEAIKRLQAIKSYMISGNPIWSAEPIGEAMDMAIEALEQSQWIPCSERLPYRFGKVLCTFIPSGGNLWTTVIIAHYSDLMGIAKPCFWVGEVGKNSFTNITEQVKAWMPLPEPWKGDEEK